MVAHPRTFLLRAKVIVTCAGTASQNGISYEQLGMYSPGALLCVDGLVVEVGAPADVERALKALPMLRDVATWDYGDCIIVPGFVDAHTHPLFAGDREPDFAARQRGERAPLGMLYTVAQTRRALEDPQAKHAFWNRVEARLKTIGRHGTTTLEVKTGYALHKDGETQLLDLIDDHKDEPGLPRLISTFLGAHALPPEFSEERPFVDYLIEHLIPVAKAHGAVYADAFCEPGFFSPVQTRRYLEAAQSHGLRLRVHCDEMTFGGAAEMAALLNVDAIDHANCIREQDVDAIVQRGIVTVACPATIAYLDLQEKAPVRALLERGGRVALASDYNPGTSPCFNLQTVAYFGRKFFGLSAAEALFGVTRAAADSLHVDAGRLAPGGRADFVALEIDSPDEFGWQFGGNLAKAVVRNGMVIA
ncbi:MAG: amidohydrolase family protein [Candidatus Eremiobacteraeota bacterium]|nr:amidohydrolase family protein [Candidatus Eremiobacteraeota bacterium]